jgi:hypothetical protein
MAPRKPKNPINDIINATSAWLGGNRGTVPSQVTRGMDVVRGIGGTLDAATGGFGRAVVSDAQSGSNTPSALYKTAAVNLAAAATGAAAARVAGKAVSAVIAGRATKATKAITPTNTDNLIYHSGKSPNRSLPTNPQYKPVHSREGFPNIHMGTQKAAEQRASTKFLFEKRWRASTEEVAQELRTTPIDRYEVMSPQTVSKKIYGDQADFRRAYEPQSRIQTYDRIETPDNEILKYKNEGEDHGSISFLVPKNRIASGDVVYRGSSTVAQTRGSFTSAELNRLRNIQTQISANQGRIGAAGAAAGVVVPKKKGRGGGAKKR